MKWLRGERVDPAAIATLLNARRRKAEIVGIDPLPRDVTPDLKTYLDARAEPPASAPSEAVKQISAEDAT